MQSFARYIICILNLHFSRTSLLQTHTLIVDEDCDEMVALFHVTGSLLYVSEDTNEVTGYDDVFTKLEKARDHYEKCGLGREYADQFVR